MTGKETIVVSLTEVQETLMLPLWARARESEKKNPLLVDPVANDIVKRIDYDFSRIEQGISEEHQLMWVIRALNFDKAVRDFLNQTDRAAVVNLGAGLDTGFQRINNRQVRWINIDLPDVAELRQKLIPDTENENTIARSLFDFSWMDEVIPMVKGSQLMFIAAGVLCYFRAPEVESLFRKMAETFAGAHFVFDAMSRLTVWGANRDIIKKSGMKTSVLLKWHLKIPGSLKKWVPSLEVIEARSMFSKPEFKKEWSPRIRWGMRIADLLRMYNLIHVRL